MILSDRKINEALIDGDIVIEPFDPAHLGSNSYDVRLGPVLACYRDAVIDARVDNVVEHIEMGPQGFMLFPGRLYLGVTMEKVGSRKYVPYLDGKSSAGRLGISVHVTAGRGDVGFVNHWTMEIFVVQMVRVYPGMPIAQFIFHETYPVDRPYDQKLSAKYNLPTMYPQPSAMWKNFR